jgi:DNA-binding GntR family transcriptional regulator
MSAVSSKATRASAVYDQLRSDLLNGQLQPGQRLKLVALGERFGVSLSVIREALTRLTEQGLVVLSPQRGFSVRPLTPQDLTDLTKVRVQIEVLALRDAIERGDVAWETGIVSTHHALARTPMVLPDGRLNDEWSEIHRSFHQALLCGCDSPRLRAIADSLRESADLYRQWSWSLGKDLARNPAREHKRLMQLALARDADATVEVLTAHIERASAVLMRYVTELQPALADQD